MTLTFYAFFHIPFGESQDQFEKSCSFFTTMIRCKEAYDSEEDTLFSDTLTFFKGWNNQILWLRSLICTVIS